MKLHLYLARRFFWLFAGILGTFVVFLALLDLVELMRRFGSDVGFADIVQLTLLNTPKALYDFLPLVMMLSSIGLFLSLARSSELVVIRAVGRSGVISLLGPAVTAAILGMLTVAMLNPIVAATAREYHDRFDSYSAGGGSTLSIGREGLWLRQGSAQGQTVIHAMTSNPDASVLYDVTFVGYTPDAGPSQRIQASSARLVDGEWELRNAKAWPLDKGLNPESHAKHHDVLTLPSTLTQDRIRDSFGTPSVISVWDLPAFIAQLEEAGFSARRHHVWLQMEMARPLFLLSMVLIGAAFTMRHVRSGGTGVAVLTAVMLGFGLYYIRNFAQILGENDQIGAMMAAWAPPVASVMLSMGLILHMEDG